MNWYIWTPVLCAVAWMLGLLMGLSLGFRVGTKRTVILFTQHFPTLRTMNALVKNLFNISNQLLKVDPVNEKPTPPKDR
jgi:hypothetical protein